MTTTLPRVNPDRDLRKAERASARVFRQKASPVSTGILIIGAIYCLFPVFWVLMAASKDSSELFSTFTLMPSSHLWDNIVELSQYRDGLFWRWVLNTAIYAGAGALASTWISAISGYVLAKFEFPGKKVVFSILLMGVLVPGVILAIPQYFLLAEVGLTNTMWSVLLPQIISPYGIYLARIYAAASVPTEVIEASRTEGAGELYIFNRIALPMMGPGLVTIFLFQFVAVWNNFMLPYIMLGDDQLFPVTVGLSGLLNQGASAPSMYTLVITGALLSIIPLIIMFLVLQRYWKVDLAAGAVKA